MSAIDEYRDSLLWLIVRAYTCGYQDCLNGKPMDDTPFPVRQAELILQDTQNKEGDIKHDAKES